MLPKVGPTVRLLKNLPNVSSTKKKGEATPAGIRDQLAVECLVRMRSAALHSTSAWPGKGKEAAREKKMETKQFRWTKDLESQERRAGPLGRNSESVAKNTSKIKQ